MPGGLELFTESYLIHQKLQPSTIKAGFCFLRPGLPLQPIWMVNSLSTQDWPQICDTLCLSLPSMGITDMSHPIQGPVTLFTSYHYLKTGTTKDT